MKKIIEMPTFSELTLSWRVSRKKIVYVTQIELKDLIDLICIKKQVKTRQFPEPKHV